MQSLVLIKEAVVGYPGRPVLRDVELRIEPGERIAILGRSGIGKSTLLNLIFARSREQAALIPQSAALVRTLSVFHNVFMGRLDRHPAWFNIKTLVRPGRREIENVRRVLEVVGLAGEMFQKAGTLSGGQQQRTSVARALYTGRPMVIGDEPVSALDRRHGAELLSRLAERHRTFVFALHDVPLALTQATRIVVLDEGGIALDAPALGIAPADLARFYGG